MSPLRRIIVFGLLGAAAAMAGVLVARWKVNRTETARRTRQDSREVYAKRTAAAAGRAEYIAGELLLAEPQKFDGRRVVLSGVWTRAFESSFLTIADKQQLWIWVDLDAKVLEPMGDFSEGRAQTDFLGLHSRHRITAEGTFRYQKKDPNAVDAGGYGHLGGCEGYFRIDRIFHLDRLSNASADQAGRKERGD